MDMETLKWAYVALSGRWDVPGRAVPRPLHMADHSTWGDDVKTRPMQERTVDAVTRTARALGAYPALVWGRAGDVEEVHLFVRGEVVASVYNPPGKGIGVWRPGVRGGKTAIWKSPENRRERGLALSEGPHEAVVWSVAANVFRSDLAPVKGRPVLSRCDDEWVPSPPFLDPPGV
jgi:hypothetical protein